MKAVATVPSLYPVLVELNVVPSILGLLNHDNTDISVGVVDLLQVWSNLKSFLIHPNFVYYQTPDRPPSGQLLVCWRRYAEIFAI